MHAQVIRGTVTDAAAWVDQGKRWRDDVRPGAIGFLGSTGGVGRGWSGGDRRPLRLG